MTAPRTDAEPTSADDNFDDVAHAHPYDRHWVHVWLWEPRPRPGHILTQDGATHIKLHQYQPGKYTWLDLTLNPLWTRLTELLPLSLAPNLVTLYGGLHCLFAYMLAWYLGYDLVPSSSVPTPEAPPPWLLLLNAYCLAVYYTLDCMDGKQARRTNTSSPVGQLFDHGLDCLCLLAHLSMVQAWVQLGGPPTTHGGGGAPWYFGLQATLQFSFFVAQWEEYYTGVLPHATGQIGVTEVSYGMALASLLNALFREELSDFYVRPVDQVLPFLALSTDMQQKYMLPLFGVSSLTMRQVFCLGWAAMMTWLVLLSVSRVVAHLSQTARGSDARSRQAAAVGKLLTPLLLSVSPFVLPHHVLYDNARYVSLAVGLAMCLVTIKLIVFSMAKQAYASVQGDVWVVVGVTAWVRVDPRWKPPGVRGLWILATLYYLVRMALWVRAVLRQLCERLDIELFRIKVKKE